MRSAVFVDVKELICSGKREFDQGCADRDTLSSSVGIYSQPNTVVTTCTAELFQVPFIICMTFSDIKPASEKLCCKSASILSSNDPLAL